MNKNQDLNWQLYLGINYGHHQTENAYKIGNLNSYKR